jgi:sec-independent protein translocase protein TatB
VFNVGGGELLVILLIALLVLGPDRLPGFARKAGKVLGEVRRVSSGFQSEIRQAMDFDGDPSSSSSTASPPAAPRLVEPPTPAAARPPTDRAPIDEGSTDAVATDTGTPAVDPAPAPSGRDQDGDETTSGSSAA